MLTIKNISFFVMSQIINTIFNGYEPYKGDIAYRKLGSLIAFETGESVTYGLFNAQDRGALFITPGVPVYEGMIVGACPKAEDITVNVCKKKHITNILMFLLLIQRVVCKIGRI